MGLSSLARSAGRRIMERLDRSVPAGWRPALALLFGESRTLAILFGVAVVLYLLLIPGLYFKSATMKEVAASKKREIEFNALAAEYVALKKRADTAEQGKTLTAQAGLIQTMDEVLNAVGVRGKMRSAKDIGATALDQQLREERAEFAIERLTLNELVNVLYKIGHAPVTLSVKGFTIRKTFDDPRLLDATLTVSLITSSPRR